MPKDDAEKAAKKARKEAKRAEAAAATANAPKLAVGTNLVQDVEMGDASKSAADKSPKKVLVSVAVEELSPIAKPLADEKLGKRLHRTIKKGAKLRLVKRGVKEVVKGIKKGEKGILVLAGDITPLDIISHLPLLAEEASIPYAFVASKEELGHASSTKRPTSCVLLCPDSKVKRKKKEGEDSKEDEAEFKTSYAKCFSEIKDLNEAIVY